MENPIQINIIEDNSVEEALKKTAKRLKSKYTKKRKINEKFLLKEKTKTQKVFSVITSIFLSIVVAISLLLCFSVMVGNLTGVPPTFAGYGVMKVQTGSMTRESISIEVNGEVKQFSSGLEIGETIVVHSVNTKTLKVGDKIAFYVYRKDYNKFKFLKPQLITGQELDGINSQDTQYKTTIPLFFGFQTDAIKEAAGNRATLVIHHITEIYQDKNGQRWFSTRGSANASEDSWHVSEQMVVGIYDDTAFGNFFKTVLGFVTTVIGLLILILIPVVILISVISVESVRAVYLAKLELDVVEEKRKITDEICVKNDIGFQMDEKTKYKVLVQAEDDEKFLYINLLWRRGEAPRSVKMYYLRKELLLRPTKRLLLVNRECERMFKEGVDPKKIAKYYNAEKESIAQEEREIKLKIKQISKEQKQEKKINRAKRKVDTKTVVEKELEKNEVEPKDKTKNKKSNKTAKKLKTDKK